MQLTAYQGSKTSTVPSPELPTLLPLLRNTSKIKLLPCLNVLAIHMLSWEAGGRKDKVSHPARKPMLHPDTIWGCRDLLPQVRDCSREKPMLPAAKALLFICNTSHQHHLRKPGDRIYLGLPLPPTTAVTGLARKKKKTTTKKNRKPTPHSSTVSKHRSQPFVHCWRWPLLSLHTSSHSLGWRVLTRGFSTSRSFKVGLVRKNEKLSVVGDILLHKLLLSPTNDTATAFSGTVNWESFLWWMKQTFSAVSLCTEHFREFSIPT